MPVIANLPRAKGRGTRKVFEDAVSVTGTADIATGLSTIDRAVASVQDAETTMPTHVASVTGLSGETVSVVVMELDTASNAIATAAKTVAIIAVGY